MLNWLELQCEISLELQGWWLFWPPNCQWKLTWLPRSRPRRTSRYCSFDFRGHAEGSPCSKDSLWLFLLQGSSDFSLVSKVPQVKNRLFPTKHLPCCKALRFASWAKMFVQLGIPLEDSWGLPMRAKSSKQRCPALCIISPIKCYSLMCQNGDVITN